MERVLQANGLKDAGAAGNRSQTVNYKVVVDRDRSVPLPQAEIRSAAQGVLAELTGQLRQPQCGSRVAFKQLI